MKGTALPFREKLGYGMGDAGCNMIGGAIMLFLNYFYTHAISQFFPKWEGCTFHGFLLRIQCEQELLSVNQRDERE